jgi:hypothetical protein
VDILNKRDHVVGETCYTTVPVQKCQQATDGKD